MEDLGIEGLKRAILQKFQDEFYFCELYVPYSKMREYAAIKHHAIERNIEYTDDGQTVFVVIPTRYIQLFQPFIQSLQQ